MVDRNDVENLLNSYSLAYDSNDMTLMEDCFTADAVFSMKIADNEPMSFETRDVIMKLMTDSLASQTDQRRHANTNLIVRADGDVVRTTSYLTLTAVENGEITLLSSGVYSNEVVQDEGKLRVRKMHLDLDRPY
jgi:ketosteroid isomerase-like protein